MVEKGRSTYGDRNPSAKLSDEMVLAIRAAEGTQAEIAKQFNVTQPTVSRVRARQIWKHV